MSNKPDIDPQETQEWLDSLEAVLENEGVDRAHFLLERLIDKVRRSGAYLPFSANTAYVNTLPVTKQERFPGNRAIEQRIRSFVRWNAMAMVVRPTGCPPSGRAHLVLCLLGDPLRSRLQPLL